jgi:dTMP kinase
MVSKRGAFIVLEGLDRSGKSSQCARLVQTLNAGLEKPTAKGIRFPGELPAIKHSAKR